MKNATILSFEMMLKIQWECPVCKAINEYECNQSPYRAVSEDPPDERCTICKNFSTLQV